MTLGRIVSMGLCFKFGAGARLLIEEVKLSECVVRRRTGSASLK